MGRPEADKISMAQVSAHPVVKAPKLSSTIVLIVSGSSLTSLLTFLRNLLIARLISVEDFGIAATFAIALTVAEMATSFGIHQFIVQDKDGNNPKFQATLQAFNLVRGIVSAAVLFASGHWIAGFMGLPDLGWAYQVLAVVPLCNGLLHYDMFRMVREMNYLPSILATTVPAFLSLCLVWPLSQMFGDFRISLWASVSQFVLMMVVSHLVAKRSYQLRFDRAVIRRAVLFGWPLLINHVLLFAVFNGERLIVGRELGMAELGILSMGITLTLTPILILANSTQRFFLPQLSQAQDTPDRFMFLTAVVFQTMLLLGAVFMIAVVFLGGPAVLFLLGEDYLPLLAILPALGMVQFLRAMQNGTSVIPLSKGQTKIEMFANVVRVAVLPVSWWAATQGVDVLTIIWLAVLAEILSLCTLQIRVHKRIGLPFKRISLPLVLVLILTGTLLGYSMIPAVSAVLPYPIVICASFGLLLAAFLTAKDLHSFLTDWRGTAVDHEPQPK